MSAPVVAFARANMTNTRAHLTPLLESNKTRFLEIDGWGVVVLDVPSPGCLDGVF